MEKTLMVLDKINTPEDLRGVSVEEMNLLSAEIRDLILKKVNTTGGHLGPNLGMVEATIALHRVFNSPVDKFVFDVSHQCYPHKILTGRKEGFTNPAKYHTYTGYTAPEESAHDLFKVGHTSTSVSLACGLAKARDLIGGKENVVAVFQPHRFTRLQSLWKEFLTAFENAGRVIVTDVYAASEDSIEGINGENFAAELSCEYVSGNMQDVARKLMPSLKKGDVVIGLGAGTITNLGKELCKLETILR